MQAAKKAQITEFLDDLPDGINAKAREGVSHLSGGQKQRISIARAMLKDAPIIILDEGKIKEQGSHSQLLKLNGLYADYWNIQQTASGWKLKKFLKNKSSLTFS